MRMHSWRALVSALVAALVMPAMATALEVPFLSGRVNDLADLLPEEARGRLEVKLADLEEATGAQVVVLTLPSLEGDTLEEFSHRVAQTWQIGRRDHDDGVLLLVSVEERSMRLEVGYGLEERLPDLVARRILDDYLRPRFRAGDYPGGIEAGVDAVAARIRGEEAPTIATGGHPEAPPPGIGEIIGMMVVFLAVVGTFSLVALFGTGCGSWFLYLFLAPFWLAFSGALMGPIGGLTGLAAWVIGVPLVKLLLHRTPAGRRFTKKHRGLVSFGNAAMQSRSGRSSGGWSSGGGFSGGGGSFGGGGASSRW